MVEYKYCLPTTFRLERVENASLKFVDRSDEFTSVFAEYLGNDMVDEVLAGWPPNEFVLGNEQNIHGLRIIRYTPNKANNPVHHLMVVFVVFPDQSIMQIHGLESTQTEAAVNALIVRIPIG